MQSFVPGQRWISETEPELGLGSVLSADARLVRIRFPGSAQERCYAVSAPLHRVAFKVGDRILDREGQEWQIDRVGDDNGLLVYYAGRQRIPETELSDLLGFSQPEDRLRHGKCDENRFFDLRRRAHALRYGMRQSESCGFLGARIGLLSHQLYIARQATELPAPRILLADEVGLGKTIEAGLILHRLLVTGRVKRVLVLLPETLIHQWFMELLRKFNLKFNIFDEERCLAVEDHAASHNPFDTEQLVLVGLDYLVQFQDRAEQVLKAGWDVLVVDEAHHLHWSPEGGAGPDYALVERLARQIPSVLLLTATPEQLGLESHYARLRLLDPERYASLPQFLKEMDQYQKVAAIAGKLLEGKPLAAADRRRLSSASKGDGAAFDALLTEALDRKSPAAREALMRELLDLHGVGRVMFRNTRSAVPGFPRRRAAIEPLPNAEPRFLEQARAEFQADVGAIPEPAYAYAGDPRIEWLAKFLKAKDEKVLVICHTKARAMAIEEALRTRFGGPMALFHEDLNLVQRDTFAARFSEPDGPRLLICSEIGSEGRNFQFACHMVLFDIPLNPEVLEQRIGRLARLGQTETVTIHVPVLEGSPQAALAAIYHQALNAFEEPCDGGWEVLEQFGETLKQQLLAPAGGAKGKGRAPASLAALQEEIAVFHGEVRCKLEAGRDRLLEMNSHRPEVSSQIIAEVEGLDKDPATEEFMLQAYECFGVHVENVSWNTYALQPQDLYADAFPMLPHEGCHVTFDRSKALTHEDWAFVTREHPMCSGAIDWIVGSEKGNCAFAHWDADGPAVFLEAAFVVQVIAPAAWHVDRFLPPTPLRFLIDHSLADVSLQHPAEKFSSVLKEESAGWLLGKPRIVNEFLPQALERSRDLAAAAVPELVALASQKVEAQYGYELQRLEALCRKGSAKPVEILALENVRRGLLEALKKTTVSLDALRLAWRGRRPPQ